ncbi:hypothetical protein MNEG_5567 [Monoraphidium neglectum]|uniref:Uncharacterized protein n=1 Tax=Monoraphidium neglectum TaxID=145388 RepID=A0A0D2MPE7_9CHLO|nr:hypothetical protein MNEG_5567 [Monoraphidium neglectum]KIZ02392.1 hypothetical protein MNEG_5567 [Monoraphidium neglectum]|eukprot:XP_013901411.1 hypothetical protein MNEG_5567 [Monoraphidium neglectum]
MCNVMHARLRLAAVGATLQPGRGGGRGSNVRRTRVGSRGNSGGDGDWQPEVLSVLAQAATYCWGAVLLGVCVSNILRGLATSAELRELNWELKRDLQEVTRELNQLKWDLKSDVRDLKYELKSDVRELKYELKSDVRDLKWGLK